MSDTHKKIVVIGASASGKSTFARKLSERIGVTTTHVDELMWRPGWKYVGDEETARAIEEASKKEEWLIEGYITKAARIDLFDKADHIIYLDYAGWLSAWRYVKRWWKYRKDPRPELPGSPETFSFEFLKRVYTKKEVWKLEKLFSDFDWDNKIVRIKTPGEAEEYLRKL